MEKPDLLQNESCGRLDREQAGLQGESPVPPAVMKGPAKKRRLVPAGTADLRGDRRVEAVVSVDGRDVVSGNPGDYMRERGYIIPPHGSVVVDGFRQSLSRAAAFRFSRPGSSYSSRMGTPENVGVIGVAFFGEQ